MPKNCNLNHIFTWFQTICLTSPKNLSHFKGSLAPSWTLYFLKNFGLEVKSNIMKMAPTPKKTPLVIWNETNKYLPNWILISTYHKKHITTHLSKFSRIVLLKITIRIHSKIWMTNRTESNYKLQMDIQLNLFWMTFQPKCLYFLWITSFMCNFIIILLSCFSVFDMNSTFWIKNVTN